MGIPGMDGKSAYWYFITTKVLRYILVLLQRKYYMNQECLTIMREIYAKFTGEEVSQSIKLIRAEMTAEEFRHELQVEILAKQAQLDKLTQKK
jgi:hypothetical protein